MKNFLIVVFCISLLIGCQSSEKVKTDIEKMNLKGDIVFLIETKGTNESDNLFLFNENGMIVRKIIGMMGNTGFMEETINYQSGKLLNSITKVISKNYNSENGFNCLYDKNGVLISKDSKDYISTYKYNNRGDLSEEIQDWKNSNFYKKINLNYFYSNHSLDSTIQVYVFSDDGIVTNKNYYERGLSKSQLYFTNNTINFSHHFEYNDNGDEISCITKKYSENNTIKELIERKFEYSYDPNGNWIEKKTITGGQVDNVMKRTLIYKGGDYTPYLIKYENLKVGFSNGDGFSNNSIDLNDGYNNNSNNQQNNTPKEKKVCHKCKGTGQEICGKCNGKGSYQCSQCFGHGIYNDKTCYVCGGRGVQICKECRGTGIYGTCRSCSGSGIERFQ